MSIYQSQAESLEFLGMVVHEEVHWRTLLSGSNQSNKGVELITQGCSFELGG